jgi:hypothetical protein
VTDDLTGVARGSETLIDVLARFRHEGFAGSFTPLEARGVSGGASLRCEQCRQEFAAEQPDVTELRRLEGASDPDDMLAAIALECPRCGARGSLVVNYGPTATTEEAAVLVALTASPGATRADRTCRLSFQVWCTRSSRAQARPSRHRSRNPWTPSARRSTIPSSPALDPRSPAPTSTSRLASPT